VALSVTLMDALRDLGYVEGQNVVFDHRFAEGKMEKLDGLATELVSIRPGFAAGMLAADRTASSAQSALRPLTSARLRI
jgi:hypothetical protein